MSEGTSFTTFFGILVGTFVMWLFALPMRSVVRQSSYAQSWIGKGPVVRASIQYLLFLPIALVIAALQYASGVDSALKALLIGVQIVLLPVAFVAGRSLRNKTLADDVIALACFFLGGAMCSTAIYFIGR